MGKKEGRAEKSSAKSGFRRFLNAQNVFLAVFIIVGLTALIFIYRTVKLSQVLEILENTTLPLFVYYAIIQVVMLLILTWRWQVVLKSQGVRHVGFWRLSNYRLVGQGVSFITPAGKLGGEPVRAGLVSTKENIPFENALSGVVVDRTIDVSSALIFFVVGAMILLLSFVLPAALAAILVIICLVSLVLIVTFNYRMLQGKNFFYHVFRFLGLSRVRKLKKFEQKLLDVENLVIKFYHKDKRHFFYAMSISLLSWALMFFEYKVAGLMVGHNLTPMQSFLVFSFIGAAYIVPVPMGLGSLEASQITAFSILGIGAAAGLALSFLVRMKDLFFALIGVGMLGMYGFSLKKTVQDTKYLDREVEKLKRLEKKSRANAGKSARKN